MIEENGIGDAIARLIELIQEVPNGPGIDHSIREVSILHICQRLYTALAGMNTAGGSAFASMYEFMKNSTAISQIQQDKIAALQAQVEQLVKERNDAAAANDAAAKAWARRHGWPVEGDSL